MSVKSYPFFVADSGWGPSYGFKTGITFGGVGDSPGVVIATTIGASPTPLASPNLPEIQELGHGQYQLLYDPEAGGDALILIDAGSQVTLSGALTPVDQSITVTGSGTAFTTEAFVGRYLVFANDPTATSYRIASIASDTSLSLCERYQSFGNTVTAGSAIQATLPNYFDRFIPFDTRKLDSRSDLAFDALGRSTLSPAGLDSVQVEPGVNARQALSPIAAAAAGAISGQELNTPIIKAVGTTVGVTRISATTDTFGNRTAVTITYPS